MRLKRITYVLLMFVMLTLMPCAVQAKSGTTVYKGVNYKRVYNYSYYMKKYPEVKELTGGDPKKAIAYFVNYGMAKQHQAIKTFNVKSYRYGNPSLRKKYRLNYKKYYLHYMKKGYKTAQGKRTRTGIKKLQKPITVYKGKDYSATYSYTYYRKHNPDVRKKYKDDDYGILIHYVKYGIKEGRPGNAKEAARLAQKESSSSSSSSSASKDSFVIDSCKISGKDVLVHAANTVSDGTEAYLFAVPSYVTSLKGYEPVASLAVKSGDVTLSAPLMKGTASSLLQKKFYIAVKSGSSYKIASNAYYIQNPEASASNKEAFPTAKRGTKKGLKTQITTSTFINKAVDLKCSHVIADFPLEAFLGGHGLRYTYEGTVYEFSSSIFAYQSYLKQLNDKGIVVTGIFYLSDPSMTKYMLPTAAAGDKSRSIIFALNTVNSNRKELEALFSCLGYYFTSGGARMANWVFGNESNQYRTYCFSGSVSYDTYIKHYCDSYRMFNTAVKSQYANARTYICFDHNWNLSFDLAGSYNGKRVLASIAKQLKAEGDIHFDVSLHPYPSPEQDPRVWVKSNLVSMSADTQQYVPMNMSYVASYIKKTYGKDVHIILPETGINSRYQGREMQAEQAAGVAYAYYKTEFDPNIDMIAIHRDLDDTNEYHDGFYLGLYGSSFSNPRKAAEVFKYMDTKSWSKYTKSCLSTIGISSWGAVISGFNGNRFTTS